MSDVTNENIIDQMQREIDELEAQQKWYVKSIIDALALLHPKDKTARKVLQEAIKGAE